MLQLKTQLDVFLAANTKEDVFDFKIKGSWFERSCIIYGPDGKTIIAQVIKMFIESFVFFCLVLKMLKLFFLMGLQMHKHHTAQSLLLGKDTFGVTVYPHVDYAFIVALVVILYEINEDRSGDD